MKTYNAEQTVRFTAQKTVRFCGRKYLPGEDIEIVLARDFHEEEGLGEGGPWGWGGYRSSFLASLTKKHKKDRDRTDYSRIIFRPDR